MANRIGVMYLGRLVEEAPARDLFRAPRHPYTRMLLDAVPDPGASGRARRPIEGEIPNPSIRRRAVPSIRVAPTPTRAAAPSRRN
jgi:ABC-type dipeptide/oligopeptide/nickel transport system ATPase component